MPSVSRGLVVVAVLALVAACSSEGDAESFVRISGRLPTVSGTTLDGSTFGPGQYAGKVLVLNFWNQDCPPCLQEAPVLQADQERLAGQGVVVVGVVFVGGGWPDNPAAARAFLERHGITYPSLVDGGSALAHALGIVGIPTTVVADRGGALRFERLGMVRPGQIEGLLAQLTTRGY
jgi:cytochrome c biogenesis protein CcmG, thiol:disulfide interchange protein DsbE